MKCPTCSSINVLARKTKTKLGYRQFNCRSYRQYFNERTGTSFNFIHYPTDIVMLVIYHYTRYKLSLVDVTELIIH